MAARRGNMCVLALILELMVANNLRGSAAAPLPIHLRWVQNLVPPSAAGPPLRDFFQSLPKELCNLGPDGIEAIPANVMDEICPLKAATRLGRVLPGLNNLADDTAIEKVAETPVTIGGALILMASETHEDAADVQKKICNVLMYPKQTCKFKLGDTLGPLYYHLDARDTVAQWLASKVVPIAIAPLGASLATLPDVLCQVPTEQLVAMPKQIRAQLCPKDVAVVPVVTLFAMGRTGSNALEAKLCDLLKRPQEACQNGRYQINNATEKRIEQVKVDTENAVYSWEPGVPDLPKLTMPVNLTSLPSTSSEALSSIAKWWNNETIPELRRYTMRSYIPQGLQQPVASLLERLPASICGMPPASIAELPASFKQQVCPVGSLLQQAQDQSGPGLHTWGYTLAEVAMGAANSQPLAGSKARLDAWLMRMCSVVYAPDIACNGSINSNASLSEVVAQRISQQNKPMTVQLISNALSAMPKSQREYLIEGVAKQLTAWSSRAASMPRSLSSTMFGPFCSLMSSTATTRDTDLHKLLLAAALDALKPLPMLGAIVGEDQANDAAGKICRPLAAGKEPEIQVAAVDASSRRSSLKWPSLPKWIPSTRKPPAKPAPAPGSKHPAVQLPIKSSGKSPLVQIPGKQATVKLPPR